MVTPATAVADDVDGVETVVKPDDGTDDADDKSGVAGVDDDDDGSVVPDAAWTADQY
jgi:hypothetical protein